jgi:hypothetical protein
MITNENLNYYCNHFYGYGKWKHPYWIIGLEEAIGNNIDNLNNVVDTKICRFLENNYTNANLIDLHHFQGGIIDVQFGLLDNFFNPLLPDFTLQRYWKRGLQLIYAFENDLNAINGIGLDHLSEMILTRWGRNHANLHNGISLIELFPLPLPNHTPLSFNKFYNAPQPPHTFSNIDTMADWDSYNHFIEDQRTQFIVDKIMEIRPQFIFMMGIRDFNNLSYNLIQNYRAVHENFNILRHNFNILNLTWPDNTNTRIFHTCQPNGAWNNDYWNAILAKM